MSKDALDIINSLFTWEFGILSCPLLDAILWTLFFIAVHLRDLLLPSSESHCSFALMKTSKIISD